jgi:archaemetzincin
MSAVEPFFKPMETPEPDEWLSSFPEAGQTFEQYINGKPTLPTDKRRTIYIQPIGRFDEKQERVIGATAEYMEDFFGLPVKLLPGMRFEEPFSLKNHRSNKLFRHRQIRTGYILDEIVSPALPVDAAAFIAFTNEDLYPDEYMNFVFGEASLANRVGVWSLYRLDANADDQTFLRRTLKIAVHETGHMFSVAHCTKYECVMSGSNHLKETDSRPIDACPECMAKICWMAATGPHQRYSRLESFAARHGLVKEREEFARKATAVGTETETDLGFGISNCGFCLARIPN